MQCIYMNDHHTKGYPTTLLLLNGKLIANYKGSRNSAKTVKEWVLNQLDPQKLREGNILREEEIKVIEQIKSGQSSGGSDQWTLSNVYRWILKDVHPTVPFVIYLVGTLSGILIGVLLMFYAENG